MTRPTGKSWLSIRGLIFAMVVPLVAITWFETIRVVSDRFADLRTAQSMIEVNQAVDHLLRAAQNLAFERGRGNVMLRQPGPASPDNRAFIAGRRHAVDSHLAEALAALAAHPAAAGLRADLPALYELRATLDIATGLPLDRREPVLAERWFTFVSARLAQIEALVGDVTLAPDRFKPAFRVLTRIKIQSLRLRNSLGVESSRIASLLASQAPLDLTTRTQIAQLRGESAAHWANLQREAGLTENPAIQAGLAGIEQRFFTEFRPVQDAVLAALSEGRPPPLTVQRYTEASVPALDALPALMEIAVGQTRALAEGSIARARAALVARLALAAGILALGGATLVIIVTRLLMPLRLVLEELRGLEAGRLDIALVPMGRRDELGEMQDAVIAFRDSLVARQHMADQLAEESERLATLIDAMPDFVCFKDGAGRWLVANEFGTRLFGLAGQDYRGRTDAELAALSASWSQTIHNCDTDERAWAKGAPWHAEDVVVGADGVARFFDVVKVPLLYPDGSRKGLLVVGRDLSERRRIEAALVRLSRQNELILECAGEGIVGLDGGGQTVFVNPAAARMTGWDPGDLLGQSHHALVHHSHADGSAYPAAECPVARTLADGETRLIADDVFWRKDGSPIIVEFMVSAIVEQGQVRGAVVVFRDIGERKSAEAEIGGLLEELRRSNAELEQFAYAVSHDLQEPLRMVSSYIQLLGRRYAGKLDGEADEFIAFAVDGAQRMSAMINALLEFARVSSRGQTPEPVDSGAALTQALHYLGLLVTESGAELALPAEMPMVMGDFNQLVSVFQNLIGNALKYRHSERALRIELTATRISGFWRFAVTDNGIGIAPEDGERVFGVFQRLKVLPQIPGTGMGLAICKRIVERLGGTIALDIAHQPGSRFVFTLPAVL